MQDTLGLPTYSKVYGLSTQHLMQALMAKILKIQPKFKHQNVRAKHSNGTLMASINRSL